MRAAIATFVVVAGLFSSSFGTIGAILGVPPPQPPVDPLPPACNPFGPLVTNSHPVDATSGLQGDPAAPEMKHATFTTASQMESAGTASESALAENELQDKELVDGPPGDRTRDTVIKSHVLYH